MRKIEPESIDKLMYRVGSPKKKLGNSNTALSGSNNIPQFRFIFRYLSRYRVYIINVKCMGFTDADERGIYELLIV